MNRAGLPILLFVIACAGPSAYRRDAWPPGKPGKAVLVVLDGFGLADPAAGNAVQRALREQPDGVLARTLGAGAHPMVPLDAAGACVGLEPGQAGNSEAGHGNLCAGEVVPQRRAWITQLHEGGRYDQAPALVSALERVRDAGRPLHIIGYLADYSSVGHVDHLTGALRMASSFGIRDVQVHAVCRGTGERRCTRILAQVQRVMQEEGVGRFSTLAGREHCHSRVGATPAVRRCAEVMLANRSGKEPTLEQVLVGLDDGEAEASLPPTAIAGGKRIRPGDDAVMLFYRRDTVYGLVRSLRGRPGDDDPVNPRGPHLLTYGQLEHPAFYAADSHLEEAFSWRLRGGLLGQRVREAGLRQLRVSEERKSAHTTYFCDAGEVADDALYRRVHPASLSAEQGREQPCLATPAIVDTAITAVRDDEADLILVNLANADLVGHTGDFEATVRGIQCMDRELSRLVQAATAAGYPVVITGDHGNAEELLRPDGSSNRNHSANPVPLIAIAADDGEPLRLRRGARPACLGTVAWTVLDLLGLPIDGGASALEH